MYRVLSVLLVVAVFSVSCNKKTKEEECSALIEDMMETFLDSDNTRSWEWGLSVHENRDKLKQTCVEEMSREKIECFKKAKVPDDYLSCKTGETQ